MKKRSPFDKNKSLLDRAERKFGRFAVKNLMLILVFNMGFIFLADLFLRLMPDMGLPPNISNLLYFSRPLILSGQVWRVLSFILLPPNTSIIFIVFALVFFYYTGSVLEREWGAFKFNLFYLCGVLGTIAAGFISGFATNMYLNLSLFLAFAILFPNYEIRIYFLIPVKVKYLAIVNALFLLWGLIFNSWGGRLSIIVSLLNIILFFGGDFINIIKRTQRKKKWERDNRR